MIDLDEDHTVFERFTGLVADRSLSLPLRHGSDARCAGDVAEPC